MEFSLIQHATRHAVEDMTLQLCACLVKDVPVVTAGVKVVMVVKAAIVVTLALVVIVAARVVTNVRVVIPAKDVIAETII